MGVIAQLGERYNGIVEVGGSIPPGSTTPFSICYLLALVLATRSLGFFVQSRMPFLYRAGCLFCTEQDALFVQSRVPCVTPFRYRSVGIIVFFRNKI